MDTLKNAINLATRWITQKYRDTDDLVKHYRGTEVTRTRQWGYARKAG